MNALQAYVAPATVATGGLQLRPMTEEAIDMVRELTEESLRHPQLQFVTQHQLHAGMYTRTVLLPAGSIVTGVLVKIPTTLHLSGDCAVFTGYETVRVTGFAVLPAAAHRKQAFHAYTDTTLSMSFVSSAADVAAAEAEFTDELRLLVPLDAAGRHQTVITGD